MDESSPTAASESAAPAFDARGKFAPGNKLGRGNPLAKRQGELRRMFMDAVTPLKMQAVEKSIYEEAVNGDMIAARLYLEYTVGKPRQLETEKDEDEGPLVVEAPLALPEAKSA